MAESFEKRGLADVERSRWLWLWGQRGVGVGLMLGVTLTLTSGCATVTSKIPGLPKSISLLPSPASTPLPEPVVLADPSDQSINIAWETARLAEQRGMDHEAIAAYLSVRRQQPDHPGVAHALAVLYDRAGRVDEAAAEYRRALTEKPDDADLLCDLGYFQYSTHRFDEAAASYRRALSLSPKHRQAMINLALLCAHQGHDDEAVRLFTEAIGPAAARHNLGMIKLQQGDQHAARELLADAAARDPSVAKKSTAVLASLESNPSIARESVSESRSAQVPLGLAARRE